MYLKKINLKNKIALVTGAGKGIGKACAIALAEAGADLIIISRTQKDLDSVSKIVKKFGYKKAVTTIRHHNEILKNSGLIEISKIEEARGGITKYYSTSTKLLDFTLPADFDKNYSKLISKTSLKLGKIVGPISKNFSKTRKIQQINYNNFIILEIVNRAMTNLLVKK